jgi:glucose-6-phosphate 1-dehydrogenase
VEITAAETVGVENRAAFYEETGALRDMVANHLLQLLALTATEPPVALMRIRCVNRRCGYFDPFVR